MDNFVDNLCMVYGTLANIGIHALGQKKYEVKKEGKILPFEGW